MSDQALMETDCVIASLSKSPATRLSMFWYALLAFCRAMKLLSAAELNPLAESEESSELDRDDNEELNWDMPELLVPLMFPMPLIPDIPFMPIMPDIPDIPFMPMPIIPSMPFMPIIPSMPMPDALEDMPSALISPGGGGGGANICPTLLRLELLVTVVLLLVLEVELELDELVELEVESDTVDELDES